MGKTVFAVVTGAVVGLILAALVGWFGGYAFPPSLQVDMDPAKARTLPMPVGEIILGLLAWILAGLGGGYVAARQSEPGSGEWPAWAAAAVMAIGAVVFAMFWPHPIWFVILSVLVVAASGFGAGRLSVMFDPDAERAG
jgi:hypothetical protein